MGKPFKIVISPEGNVVSVYNDAFDISEIGDPEIHRATEVCFNNDIEAWDVYGRGPLFSSEIVLASGFKSRQAAIDWEVDYLNWHMVALIEHRKSYKRRVETHT